MHYKIAKHKTFPDEGEGERGEGNSCVVKALASESSVAGLIQTSQRVGKGEAARQRCAPPLNKAAAEKSEVS